MTARSGRVRMKMHHRDELVTRKEGIAACFALQCPLCLTLYRGARKNCPRRTGVLPGQGTAFFAKKAVGKKAQRGDTPLWTPPKRIPAFILLRRYFQSMAWPIPGFPPIRKALYSGNRGGPRKGRPLEGSGEGNEKFPSPPFLSPISFREKKWGSRRAGGPPGEGKNNFYLTAGPAGAASPG